MTELLTAAQMRAVEAAAIASGEVTGLDLMERAGRGVVEAVFDEWPELRAGSFRAVVLCGPGGNGGDGFVVARVLKEWGWEVFLHTQDYDDLNRRRFRGGECGAMARAWVEAGGMGRPLSRESLANAMDTKDTVVLVDALLGIGQLRSADNLLSPLNSAQDFLSNVGFWADVRCVALDVPTGLDADTGQPTGECAFEADLTVSFHRGKIGHYLGEGPRWSGRLVLAEIGLPKRAGSAL